MAIIFLCASFWYEAERSILQFAILVAYRSAHCKEVAATLFPLFIDKFLQHNLTRQIILMSKVVLRNLIALPLHYFMQRVKRVSS